MPLVRWIWHSYLRASPILLLVVEVALISLYFIANEITNRENIQAIRTVAEQDIAKTLMREAVGINRQLEGIAPATEFLPQDTAIVMAGDQPFPLIEQLYYNTHDSLNRIYPYFEVLSQYPSRVHIPSYNFYYEADAKHNPQRKVGWTDVYVDPAGMGNKMTMWLIQFFPHSELVSV